MAARPDWEWTGEHGGAQAGAGGDTQAEEGDGAVTPTQRSLAKLKAEGYLVAIVEHYNPWARVRQDLFGFADLLAIKGDVTLAVQTTTGDNVSARLAKIGQSQAARLWLESPTRRVHVHGWRRIGKHGKRKLWDCRIVEVTCNGQNKCSTMAG